MMTITGTPTTIDHDFGMLPGETVEVRLNEDGTFTLGRSEIDQDERITWLHLGATLGLFRYNDD